MTRFDIVLHERRSIIVMPSVKKIKQTRNLICFLVKRNHIHKRKRLVSVVVSMCLFASDIHMSIHVHCYSRFSVSLLITNTIEQTKKEGKRQTEREREREGGANARVRPLAFGSKREKRERERKLILTNNSAFAFALVLCFYQANTNR
jgi:hypothetical protein